LKYALSFIKRRWFFVLVFLISIFCYVSVLIPPHLFWPSVFTSYAIPIVLITNFSILFFVILYKIKLSIYPVLNLLLGVPFLLVTFSFSGGEVSSESDLSVLSFNAKLFRKRNTYSKFSFDMIKWAANDTSDIKCFQEYSTNSRWPVLDVTKQISEAGYGCFAFSAEMDDAEHNPGLAIFSKYPILDSGFVWKDYGSHNGGIYADIKFGKDTLRIYNIHLASMHLSLYQYKQADNYTGKLRRLISRLKYGAQIRSYQIERVNRHVESCPYPYIICGDFNETPYSYNYFKLRSIYQNTFEEVGNGFGFSFNSPLFFLRIDHQFYNSPIIPVSFKVDRKMKISDHFPTRALYRLKH
jgi:endonuclease/exonuclease/phosphatase family metal-dependent hydrolase